MTLEEVAACLKLKPQIIYARAQEKKIPAAKLEKEWQFKKSILDARILRHMDEKNRGVVETGKQGNQGRILEH